MIKITIFENSIENVGDIRGYLRTFANNNNIIIKESVYFKIEDMTQKIADVCLIDFKAYLDNQNELSQWQEEYNVKFIFATSDIKDIVEIIQSYPEQYCLLTPIEEESLFKIFDNLKTKIK